MPVRAAELRHLLAVDEVAPGFGAAQPQQQLDQRRLARARGPDHADRFVVRHDEAEVLERRRPLPVGEVDVLELHDLDPLEVLLAVRRNAVQVALRGVLGAFDERHRLREALVGGLHGLPVRARPHQDQDHRARATPRGRLPRVSGRRARARAARRSGSGTWPGRAGRSAASCRRGRARCRCSRRCARAAPPRRRTPASLRPAGWTRRWRRSTGPGPSRARASGAPPGFAAGAGPRTSRPPRRTRRPRRAALSANANAISTRKLSVEVISEVACSAPLVACTTCPDIVSCSWPSRSEDCTPHEASVKAVNSRLRKLDWTSAAIREGRTESGNCISRRKTRQAERGQEQGVGRDVDVQPLQFRLVVGLVPGEHDRDLRQHREHRGFCEAGEHRGGRQRPDRAPALPEQHAQASAHLRGGDRAPPTPPRHAPHTATRLPGEASARAARARPSPRNQ